MSTQPPNPHLMGRSNVAMAVAQQKPKPAPKANANAAKGKMQMHRRSRTGMFTFHVAPVVNCVGLTVASPLVGCLCLC
jgi:hypothetical protein